MYSETRREEPDLLGIEQEMHRIAMEEAGKIKPEQTPPTLDEIGDALQENQDRKLWAVLKPFYDEELRLEKLMTETYGRDGMRTYGLEKVDKAQEAVKAARRKLEAKLAEIGIKADDRLRIEEKYHNPRRSEAFK